MAIIKYEFTIWTEKEWFPQELVNILMLELDKIKVGIKGTPGNYISALKDNSWTYSTDNIESNDLVPLNNELVIVLKDKMELIKSYIIANRLESKLYIIVNMAKNDIPTLELDKEILDVLTELNTSVDFDLYMYSNKMIQNKSLWHE